MLIKLRMLNGLSMVWVTDRTELTLTLLCNYKQWNHPFRYIKIIDLKMPTAIKCRRHSIQLKISLLVFGRSSGETKLLYSVLIETGRNQVPTRLTEPSQRETEWGTTGQTRNHHRRSPIAHGLGPHSSFSLPLNPCYLR